MRSVRAFLVVFAVAGCAGEDPVGPGVLELEVSGDAADGQYQRQGALYQLSVDTVDGSHRLTVIDGASGRTLIALQARVGALGAVVVDWPAMDVGESELAAYRPLFADLAEAARDWGAAEGSSAPSWLVPLLEIPASVVLPREELDEALEPDVPPGGVRP